MVPEQLDFDDLVARAAFGDQVAIGHIWRTHHPYLVRWLRSTVPEVAEDLASETWLDVMRGIRRFKGTEAGFRSWMFTIARRRVVDYQRRAVRRPDRALAVVPEVFDNADPADTATANDASERAVQLIIANLAPEQAEVVLLRVLAGLETNQVAEVLDKTPGAVRILQHRGLRRLAEVLAKEESEEIVEEGVTR